MLRSIGQTFTQNIHRFAMPTSAAARPLSVASPTAGTDAEESVTKKKKLTRLQSKIYREQLALIPSPLPGVTLSPRAVAAKEKKTLRFTLTPAEFAHYVEQAKLYNQDLYDRIEAAIAQATTLQVAEAVHRRRILLAMNKKPDLFTRQLVKKRPYKSNAYSLFVQDLLRSGEAKMLDAKERIRFAAEKYNQLGEVDKALWLGKAKAENERKTADFEAFDAASKEVAARLDVVTKRLKAVEKEKNEKAKKKAKLAKAKAKKAAKEAGMAI